MDNFIDNLADEILETVEENAKYGQHMLKMDIKRLLLSTITEHDEEVRRETKEMLYEDEVYEEGYDDGYANGWNDAREEIQELARDMRQPRKD